MPLISAPAVCAQLFTIADCDLDCPACVCDLLPRPPCDHCASHVGECVLPGGHLEPCAQTDPGSAVLA